MTNRTAYPVSPRPLLDNGVQDALDSAGFLGQLVAGLGDGVWDWDLDTDRVNYSPRFMAMLGYERNEVFASQFSFRSHLHPDDVAKTIPLVHRVLDGHQTHFDATYRLRMATGGYRWFQGRGMVLAGSDGQTRRFSGVLIDVHARMEAELQRQQRDQQQRQRLRQDSLAEWCRCLAPGLVALQERAGSVDWHHLPQYLAVLGGKQGQHLEMTDLRFHLPVWVAELRTHAPEGVTCTVRLSDDPTLPVLLDRTQLRLLLEALCTNAWQAAASQGGAVEVLLALDDSGQGLDLVVADNGPGVPAEVLDRVFEPFFTTRPPGAAWGLGLTVARQLAKWCGGRLRLDSQPGKGTEVHLWLPLATSRGLTGATDSGLGGLSVGGQTATSGPSRNAAKTESVSVWSGLPHSPGVEPAAVVSQPGGAAVLAPSGTNPNNKPEHHDPVGQATAHAAATPRHVVYVDDYEAMVYLMTRMLTRRGHRVTAFERASEALAYLQTHGQEVDLLVSDYNMPGQSGLDVVRQVARWHPGLPTVLTSGHITPSMAAEAEAEGVLQVLNRQESVEEQVAIIVQLLSRLPERADSETH